MLTARVYPSTKFAADFYARLDKRSTASWMEGAVRARVETERQRFGHNSEDFDDPDPGVSWVRIILARLPLDADEEALGRFVLSHKPMFCTKVDGQWLPDRQKLSVVWPEVKMRVAAWEKSSKKDVWEAGHEMAAELKKHKIIVKWGPNAERE